MKQSKLAIFVALALVGSFVYAHTELSQSMPADKAVLATVPKEVILHFSEPVRLTAMTIEKQGERKRDLGPLPAEMQKDFSIASPALDNGQYRVIWRALSEDTHVMHGEFVFAVGEGGMPMEHSEEYADHAEHTESHSH